MRDVMGDPVSTLNITLMTFEHFLCFNRTGKFKKDLKPGPQIIPCTSKSKLPIYYPRYVTFNNGATFYIKVKWFTSETNTPSGIKLRAYYKPNPN